MAGQNDLTTTVPKVTLADISDPTLHRLNLIVERLFGLVAVTDQKTSEIGRKLYRAPSVQVNAGYTPPTPGGEAPVLSPLDPPNVPTNIQAALVTDPGGDRFGFRTTWSAPSPPGGTVKYDVWCKFYGYDVAASGWTYSAGSEESDFIPLGGTDELFLESGYWALPDHTQRAKIWVRALNGVDDATVRVEASYAAPGYIEITSATLSTAAPPKPSNVATEIIPKDGNYGLKTTWAPPVPPGTATDYEVEAGFWTNAALTINDVDADNAKNWIPLGGTQASQLISGFWPRPTDAPRWCKTRVRSVNNHGGAVSAWEEASAAVVVSAYVDDYVPPEPPAEPTAPQLSIIDSEGNFGLLSSWTAPASPGGTVGYDVEARYWLTWTGTALADPESGWIPLGGTDATSLTSGFWPRPSANRYVKIRVRSKNEINATTGWVEMADADRVVLEPVALPPAPTGVAATITDKDGNYGITTTWTAAAGSTRGYEVRAYFWTHNGTTYVNDVYGTYGVPADDEKNYILLGGTWETRLVSGFWPRPTDQKRYCKVRVYSHNILGQLSSAYSESAMVEVQTNAAVAPAPNATSVSASVTLSGDRWGFTATIVWPANRAEIDNAMVYIVGPIGTADEIRKPWSPVLTVPVSGNTTMTQKAEWERPAAGEANQQYRLEVETYNAGNVPTDSPVASSPFTVTAMSTSLVVTGLTATRSATTSTADGVEVYGVVGSYTIPNNTEIDCVELTIRNISDANSKETVFTRTAGGGGDIGSTVNYATDLWTCPSTAQTIRISAYVINKAGKRMAAVATADVVITPGSGGLKLNRADASTVGGGVTISGGKLIVNPGPGVYLDGSNRVALKLDAADFVVDGLGQLSQNAVNLGKAYNFDTGEFKKESGVLKINAIAVNKLLAGTALFTGDVTFGRASTTRQVVISGSGITIQESANVFVTCSASGVTIQGATGSILTMNSTGLSVSRGSNSVTVTANGVVLTGATTISTPDITVTGAASVININSSVGFKCTAVGAWAGATTQLADYRIICEYTPYVQKVEVGFGGIGVYGNNGYGGYWRGVYLSSLSPGGYIQIGHSDVVSPWSFAADSASNRISTSRPYSYISLSGSGSYCYFPTYKVSTTSEVVNYNGTWMRVWYITDINTGTQYKIPLIP